MLTRSQQNRKVRETIGLVEVYCTHASDTSDFRSLEKQVEPNESLVEHFDLSFVKLRKLLLRLKAK